MKAVAGRSAVQTIAINAVVPQRTVHVNVVDPVVPKKSRVVVAGKRALRPNSLLLLQAIISYLQSKIYEMRTGRHLNFVR